MKYIIIKRFLELLSLVLFFPFLLIITTITFLLVAINMKNKLIYKADRIGKFGKKFTMYKFRTMSENIDYKLYFEHNEERISRIGKFLRVHRLDELPQIWNVIKGDMSIIGPRPEHPIEYEILSKEIDNYSDRKSINPGITGWAQVNVPHTVTLAGHIQKTKYDLEYLSNISFYFDLKIIIRTLYTIFTGKGSK